MTDNKNKKSIEDLLKDLDEDDESEDDLEDENDNQLILDNNNIIDDVNSEDELGKNVLKTFQNVSIKILSNYDEDREQLQKTIDVFKEEVEGDKDENNIKKATKHMIEGYVNLLKIKSENNASSVKLLDAMAKLMAAGRGTNIFNVNASSIDKDKLSELLNDDE